MESNNIGTLEWGESDFFDVDAVSNLRRILRKMDGDDKIVINVDMSKMGENEFISNARKMKVLKDESYRVQAVIKCTPGQKALDENAFQSGVQVKFV